MAFVVALGLLVACNGTGDQGQLPTDLVTNPKSADGTSDKQAVIKRNAKLIGPEAYPIVIGKDVVI